MGCCLSEHQAESPHATNENPKLSSNEEKQLIEVKIDAHAVDPWQYSDSLSVNEVRALLENVSFDACKEFVAPIKYAKCVRVYDGDTIHVAAPLFDGVISRFRVRLNGIDAPELRTKDEWEKKAGYIVRDILANKIENEIVELRDVGYDKYGRILCQVILPNDNDLNINQWLLDIGWACAYEGKGAKLVKTVNWEQKVAEYNAEKSEQ